MRGGSDDEIEEVDAVLLLALEELGSADILEVSLRGKVARRKATGSSYTEARAGHECTFTLPKRFWRAQRM